MKQGALIECRSLCKAFSGRIALDNVDLSIGRGRIVGLLGPNGSGKTTLIKLMNGLINPTKGELFIDGQKPGPYTKSVISYLPDRPYFADWMTVKDVLNMFMDFYKDFDADKAQQMCASMGIQLNDRIRTMSKGTREKVQLILVMSRKAQLYLLDEPIAGVDPAARDYILSTIINNYNEDGTVVIFIMNGRIVRHEAVDDIRAKEGRSIDEVFKDTFRMVPYAGVNRNDR